eukprot:4665122-Amphidinium_carterae.1
MLSARTSIAIGSEDTGVNHSQCMKRDRALDSTKAVVVSRSRDCRAGSGVTGWWRSVARCPCLSMRETSTS